MISDAAKENFATLLRAAKNGRLALLECTRQPDGATVPVVCAVSGPNPDEQSTYDFVPLAEFTAGFDDPYERFDPPKVSGPHKAKALAEVGALVHPEGLEPDDDAPAIDVGALT